LARVVFEEIVGRSDFGIDLHTAAIRRTNHPNVRGDLRHPQIKSLAESFGCEIIVDEPGPEGAFRRAATDAGCPTIILEAGEIWKMEPKVVQVATRGIKNVLRSMQMLEGSPSMPPIQHRVTKTQWIRANHAGFLEFHVVPGGVVRKDQPIATSTSLLGRKPVTIWAPNDGIVLGITTLPVTAPGEPVCHLAHLDTKAVALDAAVVRLTDVA
jgi:predicted deacylase